jgi:X-X-X-Leu-X-X-Gly heptad repeat protein
MAISQLITTINISDNKVGINSTPVAHNVLTLGSGQNVGIGELSPLVGLHIGSEAFTIPAVYLESADVFDLPPVAVDDGMFFVREGAPMFSNSAGIRELSTGASDVVSGTDQLVAGKVTITEPSITVDSIIFITRMGEQPIVDIGTLSIVAAEGEFFVKSTVATDIGTFGYTTA